MEVIRIIQQALQLQQELLGIFWTLIQTIPEDDLAITLSEKLLGHLLKRIVVLSNNHFAVHGICSLMKACYVIYKDVPKKKLEEYYKQTIGAYRCMNYLHYNQLFMHVELTRLIRSKYMNCGISCGEFQLLLKRWRETDSLK